MKSVCVFCGSSPGRRIAYKEAARALGKTLAKRGLRLVYGGGNVGLMGVVADAALEAGGEAIGAMPDFLVSKEVAHKGLTKLYVVGSMHERKMKMAEFADAFIALPGGFGTLEEFCEVLTWAQLGLHQKPCGLLNVEGYFDPLLAFFDRAVSERFLKPELHALAIADSDPDRLLDRFLEHQAPTASKWIEERAKT